MIAMYLPLATIDGLRMQPGLADTWWVAAALAVVFVAVAFLVEQRTINTPLSRKYRFAIIAFVLLAVVHVVFAVGLRLAIWTPEQDPPRFHRAIAEHNYRALDEYRAATGAAPRSLEELEQFEQTFELAGNQVPYFRDAWGRALRYDPDSGHLISSGRDGEPGTDRDLPIPRPGALAEDNDNDSDSENSSRASNES